MKWKQNLTRCLITKATELFQQGIEDITSAALAEIAWESSGEQYHKIRTVLSRV
jgi:hypothetical protein